MQFLTEESQIRIAHQSLPLRIAHQSLPFQPHRTGQQWGNPMKNQSKTKQALIQELEKSESERKLVEEALRDRQEELTSIYESAPLIMLFADEKWTIKKTNSFTAKFVGRAVGDMINLRCGESLHCIHSLDVPEGCGFGTTCRDCTLRLTAIDTIETGQGYHEVEARMILSDGKKEREIIFLLSTARLTIKGQPMTLVSMQDITTRKQAEEQIHESLREKETLLKEVHHRVKNNMQVISGLLDLQARSTGNPVLLQILNESQGRIQAMSLVHEKLYKSKDFARIDMAGYVRTLSQELFQSHKINPGKIDLIVQIHGDVHLDINKAIPCGLILNELISNAFKHAFPGNRQGELQIILCKTINAEIEIVVRDNGIGLPEDVDPHQPRTVGLHLLNGLAKNQLDGEMQVLRDSGGTEIRIKFPS
jgi:two-component sensor histidine kinase